MSRSYHPHTSAILKHLSRRARLARANRSSRQRRQPAATFYTLTNKPLRVVYNFSGRTY